MPPSITRRPIKAPRPNGVPTMGRGATAARPDIAEQWSCGSSKDLVVKRKEKSGSARPFLQDRQQVATWSQRTLTSPVVARCALRRDHRCALDLSSGTTPIGMNKRPMRKSSSIGGFAIDDLVDVGDAVQKVNCAENMKSVFHRVPSLASLGLRRLESINTLTKNKTRLFFYLFVALVVVVVGALVARVAFKRHRETRHLNLALEVAAMAEPLPTPPDLRKISIVETLQVNDLPAFGLQLRSLRKFFNIQDIETFLVVVNKEDQGTVEAFVEAENKKFKGVFPFRVVTAASLIPELTFLTKHSESETAPYYQTHKFGYITRMIVKLAAGEWFSGFYLALDADVLCTRPSSFTQLIHDGRATVNAHDVTASTSYQWKGALHVLDGPAPVQHTRAFGGVPALYHRSAVHKLKTYLEIVYQQPWRYSLLRYLYGWTDSSLYFSFLKMAGMFEQYHAVLPEGVVQQGMLVAGTGTVSADAWENADFSSVFDANYQGSFAHFHKLQERVGTSAAAEIEKYLR